jgi:hypothetical protein
LIVQISWKSEKTPGQPPGIKPLVSLLLEPLYPKLVLKKSARIMKSPSNTSKNMIVQA